MSAGQWTMAKAYSSFVFGRFNDTTATSTSSWIDTDPLFIIGNGSGWDDRNNAVTVLKNGNFGINISNPSYKLHVDGGAQIANTGMFQTGIEVNMFGSGNRNAFIDFHGDDTYSDYGLRIIRDDDGPNAYSEILHRGTGNFHITTSESAKISFGTNGITDRFVILPNGRVGIGTGSPARKLDVNGNARITGNVGIGTSNPTQKLEVIGSVKIQDYLYIGNSSGPITENWWEFGTDSGGGTAIDFHSNSAPTDFSARIYRHPGNNGNFEITNNGSGNLNLNANGDVTLNGISFFVKVGNNGTVSGDTYCRGSQYEGRAGACIGVKRKDNGAYVNTNTIPGTPVDCLCTSF
jgi:hypothetical protein